MSRKCINKRTRYEVLAKCDNYCAYCMADIDIKSMQVDHYYPVHLAEHYRLNYRIDVNAYRNLLPTCRSCNHYKRGHTPKYFRELIQTLRKRVEAIYINKVAANFGIITIKDPPQWFWFETLMFHTKSHVMDQFPDHPFIYDKEEY